MDLIAFGSLSVNVAVLVSLALSVRLAGRHADTPPRRALAVMGVLAICTLVGGRLHYILNHPTAYSGRWLLTLKLWEGGFHLPGGILALVLLAPLVCRRFGISAGRFGDAITPAITLGIAVTRLGCTIAGCCTGEVCTAPWCVAFPAGTSVYGMHRHLALIPEGAAWSLPVLPLQIGFFFVALSLTAFAVLLQRRKRYDGQVALATLFLFAASTAALEPFRGYVPEPQFWGPLPRLAWEALGLALVCGLALLVAELRHRRSLRHGVVATPA